MADKLNALNNGKALAVPGDITDANTTRRLVQEAAKFGNGKLHIIVNNAGYTWDAVVHKVLINSPLQHVLAGFSLVNF